VVVIKQSKGAFAVKEVLTAVSRIAIILQQHPHNTLEKRRK
jgi:hypothetical protein